MTAVVWERSGQVWAPFLRAPGTDLRTPVKWAPQPGSQEAFLASPLPELLYEGERGPGKTQALLADFAQHVGVGYGADWRGILFRRTYPELEDVVAKSTALFHDVFPRARFNESKFFWRWPSGEQLFLRHFGRPANYWAYHGHAYPWIAWEELANWPDDSCYRPMFSCNRATRPNMPRKVRATANPYGVGHNWVKMRFRLPGQLGHVLGPVILDGRDENGVLEPARGSVCGKLSENRVLLTADPEYVGRIRMAARNAAELAAWLTGSWDIVAGGMLDDVWYENKKTVLVEPFVIPSTWRIDRSFDWGSSRPFSVGWWAESDGSDYIDAKGQRRPTIRGDVFRIAEWYGWTGRPNEGLRFTNAQIAEGIVMRERNAGWRPDPNTCRVRPGPADSSIFDSATGASIASEMAQLVAQDGRHWPGPQFSAADKSPGTRKRGWQTIRGRIQATSGHRERPGLFVFNTCTQFIRTVPVLPRDDRDLDDVDTEAEDHIGDEVRYRLYSSTPVVRSGHTRGM